MIQTSLSFQIHLILIADFAIQDNMKCQGHFRIANNVASCAVECLEDSRCIAFSESLTNSKQCFLYDKTNCAAMSGWITGVKGMPSIFNSTLSFIH